MVEYLTANSSCVYSSRKDDLLVHIVIDSIQPCTVATLIDSFYMYAWYWYMQAICSNFVDHGSMVNILLIQYGSYFVAFSFLLPAI